MTYGSDSRSGKRGNLKLVRQIKERQRDDDKQKSQLTDEKPEEPELETTVRIGEEEAIFIFT